MHIRSPINIALMPTGVRYNIIRYVIRRITRIITATPCVLRAGVRFSVIVSSPVLFTAPRFIKTVITCVRDVCAKHTREHQHRKTGEERLNVLCTPTTMRKTDAKYNKFAKLCEIQVACVIEVPRFNRNEKQRRRNPFDSTKDASCTSAVVDIVFLISTVTISESYDCRKQSTFRRIHGSNVKETRCVVYATRPIDYKCVF